MTDVKLKEVYPVPENFRKKAYISSYDQYQQLWQESLDDPDGFWGKVAEEQVTWFKKWDKVSDFNYGTSADDLYIRWFTNAKLNVSYNCLDRHLETRGDQTAIIWEGNDPSESKKFSYKVITRSRAVWTMSSTFPVTGWEQPKSNQRWSPIQWLPNRLSWGIRTPSKGSPSMLL